MTSPVEAGSYPELSVVPGVVAELAGYAVGAVLSLLLLRLAGHSSDRRNTPQILLGLCALTWNLGGLVKYWAVITGATRSAPAILLISAVTFSAAAFWPASGLAIWLDNASLSEDRLRSGKRLLRVSLASGALIALFQFAQVWSFFRPLHNSVLQEALQSDFIRRSTAYNAFLIFGAGAWLLVRGQPLGRLQKLSVAAVLVGITISSASIVARAFFHLPAPFHQAAVVLEHQSIILVVIGSLFYLARFRSLDVFVKWSLRVLVTAAIAVAASFLAFGVVAKIGSKTLAPGAVAIAGVAALTAIAALLAQSLSAKIDVFIERSIFCRPDYRMLLREVRQQLAAFETSGEVFAAAEQCVREALELQSARMLPCSALPKIPATHELGEPERQDASSHGADLLVPIIVANQPAYFFVLVRRNKQDMLLTIDLDFVHQVAEVVGRRLEALDRQKEQIERVSREAQLVNQVVSAELRALRAQVNPHFLFNALNTIAALIPPEPDKAELMTVRLAKVFRHVLTHADQSFSSIEEEIDFLRTYLEIEKVRFGDRLRVRFEIDAEVVGAPVPSLILQPLVENALKHGLAPKLGNNELVIRALRCGDLISLSVEDNGVGLGNDFEHKATSTGVGLSNVEERLRTIYGSQARLVLEDVPQGGSRATVQIPTAGVIA
jgi:two-component system LytT family sensor kinase